MPWLVWLLVGAALAADPTPRGPRRVELPLLRPWEHATKIFVEVGLPDGGVGLFLVDTGSDLSIVSDAVAHQLDLTIDPEAAEVLGISGVTPVDMGHLPWLRLGGVTVPDVEVAVGMPPGLSAFGAMPVAGLLGNDVWSRFVVDLDLNADVLTLHAPGSARAPRRAAPLVVDGGHLLTPVQIVPENAPHRPLSAVMHVDTAAHGLLLRGPDHAVEGGWTEAAEPLVGFAGPEGTGLGATLRPSRRFPVSEVRLAGSRLRQRVEARWVEWDAPGGTDDALRVRGLVGHEVLAGRRIVLDPAARLVWMRPAKGPPGWHDGLAWAEAHPPADPLARAAIAAARGRLDEADTVLAAAVRATSTPDAVRAVAQVTRARIARQAGDPDTALARIESVDPRDLGDGATALAVVDALLVEGRVDAAARVLALGRLAELDGPSALVAEAEVASALGDHERAASLLAEATRRSGDPSAWALRRARVALTRGDLDGALATLRSAALADPTDGRALWLYALLAAPRDEGTLRRDLDVLVGALHPRLRPLDFLAGAYRAAGDAGRAQALVAEGLARDCAPLPPGPEADNCAAWYQAMAGEPSDDALTRVDRALQLAGPRSAFLDTRAVLLAARGDAAGAAAAATQAARLAPDDAYLRWQAAHLATVLPPKDAE